MQYSLSTYSLSQWRNKNGKDIFDSIKKAKELGFDAVEILKEDIKADNYGELVKAAGLIRECAAEAQIEISNLATSGDFLYGSNGDFEAEAERLKKIVDIAEIIGAPKMRHDVCYGYKGAERSIKGFEQALPRIADGCRKVTEYASGKGIVTMIENHGFFCQDSDRIERLVTTVAHENFGVLIDIGNFLCVDENPAMAVSRLAGYAKYVHAKDFIVKSGMQPNPGAGFFGSRGGNYLRGTIIGHGGVPVAQCLSILKNNGYNGFIAIEFEGMEDSVEAAKIGLQNLKRYVGA